jgi:glycosyltransferase involved in cell wall biosynthesis
VSDRYGITIGTGQTARKPASNLGERNVLTTVLYIEHLAGIGGGQVYLIELLKKLDRSRFNPVVTLVAPGEMYDRVVAAGATAELLDIRSIRRRHPGVGLGAVTRLMRLIRRHGVGVIHVNSQKALIFALPAGLLTGTPVVWHCHVDSDFGRFYDLVGSALARVIVTNSNYVSRRFDGIPWARRKIRLVYNGIDVERIRPSDGSKVRKELGIEEAAFVVGTVGRVQEEKGTRYLIEAAPRIAEAIPDALFVVVGGTFDTADPYRQDLYRVASDLGVAGRTLFTGFRADVADCLAAMDVVVVPSLREAFGLVVAEALAMERPVVATRVGGIPEMIDDGRTGVLVSPRDSTAIADAVVALRRNWQAALEMGKAGRVVVASRFNLSAHVREIQNIYEELVRS